jgi:hypothetical protein
MLSKSGNTRVFFEQIKAATAIAGYLIEPIAFINKIRLPLTWVFIYQ